MGVACLGDRALAALLTGGMFRGHEPHTLHQCPWAFKVCQVPHVCHQGDSHCKLPSTQSLACLDHGGHTPGGDLLVACLVETLEAFVVCAHGSDLFLENDVLSRCGTDDFREPSEVGRAPMSPAHGADIV
jgi:hypothetical protein